MRVPFVVIGLVFLIGCETKPNRVQFVVPKGFHGNITLRKEASAPPIEYHDGEYIVRVPENGLVRFGSHFPFESYLASAKFTDGEELWVHQNLGDHPRPGQLGLFGGYTNIEGGSLSPTTVDYRWFVGTEAQWLAADK